MMQILNLLMVSGWVERQVYSAPPSDNTTLIQNLCLALFQNTGPHGICILDFGAFLFKAYIYIHVLHYGMVSFIIKYRVILIMFSVKQEQLLIIQNKHSFEINIFLNISNQTIGSFFQKK